MATTSTNLGLNIPTGDDTVDFDKFFTQNFNKIDTLAAPKPYVEAVKPDTANIQPSTWTRIQSTAVSFGSGTWNNSGTYTIGSEGTYAFYLSSYMNLPTGSKQYAAVYVNGVLYDKNRLGEKQSGSIGDANLIGTTFIKLLIGDVVSFYIYHNDPSAAVLTLASMKIVKL
jgi:hypothetical protein